MQYSIVFHSVRVAAILILSVMMAADSIACSCRPDINRSLCQLGDEANAGGISNFMAIVKLTDSTHTMEETIYNVEVIELLAGVFPTEPLTLVQYNPASCSQYEFIEPGATGVLVGKPENGITYPDFCTLGKSFFKMVEDTVFLPLDLRGLGPMGKPYTLTDFRANNCENFSNSKEIAPANEAFSISYDSQTKGLEIIILDPYILSETLAVSVYSSNGQHILETFPSAPIDISLFPPGMYAILIRNEQQAWSKAFVKPN